LFDKEPQSLFKGYDKYLHEGFVKKGRIQPNLAALRMPQSILQKFMKKENVDHYEIEKELESKFAE
jgi:hypothetical protein